MNSRRRFLAVIFGFGSITEAQTSAPSERIPPGYKKYYITGGRHLDPAQNDCNVSPLVCYGKDLLDADRRSGVTIWEESQYEAAFGKNGEKWVGEFCRNNKGVFGAATYNIPEAK